MHQADKRSPAITVLMSVYNGARWLDEAISSVLSQSFIDFEFIIVNDGSTDQSLEIINKFAGSDGRIVVINKPNTGLADSLNKGIQKARGAWIARLDADDLCEPERLEKQYKLAITIPNVVLIGSDLQEIDENSSLGKIRTYPIRHRELRRHLISGKFFAHSSAFFKTEIVRNVGGYRTAFFRAQDYDLWLRMVDRGCFAATGEPLIKYRIHPDMLSNYLGKKPSIVFRWIALTMFQLKKSGHPISHNTFDADNALIDFISNHLLMDDLFTFFEFREKIKYLSSFKTDHLDLLKAIAKTVFHRPCYVLWIANRYLFAEYFSRKLASTVLSQEKIFTLDLPRNERV